MSSTLRLDGGSRDLVRVGSLSSDAIALTRPSDLGRAMGSGHDPKAILLAMARDRASESIM
jgi:hypothetical protein